MTDNLSPTTLENLRVAERHEIVQTLAFALQFNGKRAINRGKDMMDVTYLAGHLAEHLQKSLFVVMKKPPVSCHSSSDLDGSRLRETASS